MKKILILSIMVMTAACGDGKLNLTSTTSDDSGIIVPTNSSSSSSSGTTTSSSPTPSPSPSPSPSPVAITLSYDIAYNPLRTQTNVCSAGNDTYKLCSFTMTVTDPTEVSTILNLYQTCTETTVTGGYNISCGTSHCQTPTVTNCSGTNITSYACELPPFTWYTTTGTIDACNAWAYGNGSWENVWSSYLQAWQ